MKTQFVTNSQGEKMAVILPVKDYEKMMMELDEYECIKAYDKVKAGKQEFIPAADMFRANSATKKAVEDAKNGETHKAKSLEKLFVNLKK